YGDSIETFKEEKLLKEFASFTKKDWNGSTWPPNVMHRDLWDLVGGMSVEFHPGMYSDPDLSKKLWDVGVRYYKGVGKSRVYHFGSKSTKRIKRNIGSKTFLSKWGMSSRNFTQEYLERGRDFEVQPAQKRLSLASRMVNIYKKIRVSF
ncbi:MAG: glycosyltransferase family 2 protein, partial [Bacteroidales bacterium]|nr:glycosyltransferase family 2 protein [Bacteroidales bacterium]